MSSAIAGSFIDHPRKIHFRKNWAKPILAFLHARLQKKLIYLGLPGYRALDILEWQDFLKIIIAFQAVNYDGRDATVDSDKEMNFLIEILNDLEAKKIIETYALYVGYIEQVVMSEEDDSNEPFALNDYITVYNLDFCNTLSKPFEIIGKDNKVYECFKIDVIEKLISIQRDRFNNGANACFAMFLTVNSHFFERMVTTIDDQVIKNYIANDLKGIIGDKRLIRLLKAYTFYKLNEVFKRHNFHIEILPAIYYMGSGTYYDEKRKTDRPFWLLTFTILGTPINLNDPPISYQQDFKEFLKKKFVFINDQGISCFTESSLSEDDYSPQISDLLSTSHTVTKLWTTC